mgnify:FL=1
MTPQERQMIDELFDRLARVEAAPRDRDAEAAIAEAWQRAPNAAYALVQTVLVQDEALKRANARIQELESGGATAQQPSGGFLDSMRDSLFGQNQSRGSVPNVRPPGGSSRPAWNTGQVLGSGGAPQEQYPPQQQQPASGGGGSFLGTAAAAAAGMVGGSLLLGSIRSMMGGGQHGFGSATGLGNQGGGSNPWGSDQSGGNLARDAGVNDIGSGDRSADASRAGQFDQAQADADQDQDQDQDDEDDYADNDDDGFDGGGDSDYA